MTRLLRRAEILLPFAFAATWVQTGEKPAVAQSARAGQDVTLPVVRDTWFSNVGTEADANLGGAPRLKLKSIQEMSLIDIDPKPLVGKTIRSATLYVKSTGEPILKRVTVGTFGAPWVEGTTGSYAPQKGSSSFNHRAHPDGAWTVPGSDLCSVILGQGGTTWGMADATRPDTQGWQRIAVDPRVVAARVAGVSEGLFLFDDTGSEWTRQGEQFERTGFPNRFVYSRDSNRASAPYLTVTLGPEDHAPPAPPRDIKSEAADLPAGEAKVSWATPGDNGPAGTVGFLVNVDGKPAPRYLIPVPGSPDERVLMILRDLELKPRVEVMLSVRAVDGAGNVSPAAETRVRVSDRVAAPLPGVTPRFPPTDAAPSPRLGNARVSVVDELDKVHPTSAEMIPKQDVGYLRANHLWSARDRRVRLHAARNEFVGFQIVVEGSLKGVRPALTFEKAPAAKVRTAFGVYQPVSSSKGPLPDPIVPLEKVQDASVAGQTSGSLHVELYVPHDATPGDHAGTLTLKRGQDVLSIEVSLRVWDFTLPDSLSFLPEMNCYGLPDNERDYYRLAHVHRTVLNRVPYGQSGIVADGCAPKRTGRKLDWSAWDRRFGPYFDGSAFADLPRKRVPIECFYLPMHENWPTPIEGHYNGDYWADRGFSPDYRRNFVEAARQTAEHFHARGWKDTLFQGFLNNKVDFKSRGWSRGSSPWLLDEPANSQDFWALRYFAMAFHEGVSQTTGPAKLVFRCDISRPQWQRDSLDGLLDYNVVSNAMRPYHRMVMDRKAAEGQLVIEYGGTNAIEESNMQPVGWCLDAWSLGCDGVLPWQTVGTGESWKTADTEALFYPSRTGGAPVPSIRLKAYRRGQQDVEYLTLIAAQNHEPRWALGGRVRDALRLTGERRSTGAEDAGLVQFAGLKPQDEWALRVRIGEILTVIHPASKSRLVELKTPRRDPARVKTGDVVGPGG